MACGEHDLRLVHFLGGVAITGAVHAERVGAHRQHVIQQLGSRAAVAAQPRTTDPRNDLGRKAMAYTMLYNLDGKTRGKALAIGDRAKETAAWIGDVDLFRLDRRPTNISQTFSHWLTNPSHVWQQNANAGSGSTADAICMELQTGRPLNLSQGDMRTHEKSIFERILSVQHWIDRHPNASQADVRAATEIIIDLRNALPFPKV